MSSPTRAPDHDGNGEGVAPKRSSADRKNYPPELKAAEFAALHRRRAANPDAAGVPTVGVALSGGGIRSATFCLGLFQALARQRLVRRIDFLSTVSGGGYFGTFLGSAFARDGASPESVEKELSNNHSWIVNWLRENGRFLSPNGAGDNWLSAAVGLRNWVALHVVLLTFGFLVLGVGELVRADLSTGRWSGPYWRPVEEFFWEHQPADIWWSAWFALPVATFLLLMVPSGTMYWFTQHLPLMRATRMLQGIFHRSSRSMSDREYASRAQNALTRAFMLGLIPTVALALFAVVDSVGQTLYLRWSAANFQFPSLWAILTGTGVGLFGFGAKLAVYVERLLGKRGFRLSFDVVALTLSLLWAVLIVVGLSVLACGLAFEWSLVWNGETYHHMSGGWQLMTAVTICFAASWIFSRSFGFVNLSSMQQVYAARLARAYLGATNRDRQRNANHSMTDLMPGDDLPLDDYAPHVNGGPLHLINVTVNETISGKTQIERRDRKGLAMAVGPAGLSVGTDSHALWAAEPPRSSALARLQALWDSRKRPIVPIMPEDEQDFVHALCTSAKSRKSGSPQLIEALSVGRWVAVSGAAFTTGTGSNTTLGLSLLLGLANVRLGYWWDSGITPGTCAATKRPNFLEVASRVLSRVLPVQTYLLNEFFARFHGPGRRHWYLSDGGHFENTGCYELVRRRVPLIICSDAGQDPRYEFADLANLVRKARIDFGAEIQIVRRAGDLATDDPGVRFPMPKLEEVVHPGLLDVIGTPDDFAPTADPESADDDAKSKAGFGQARRHAVLARIHYLDNDQFSWLLMVKPSVMGDEAADVIQYQKTHPLFPQEPTSDQYFDEAQWESYRKLGEHVGMELFTPPSFAAPPGGGTWSPSLMQPPEVLPALGMPALARPAPRRIHLRAS
ncbi:MAG: hypothetical protein ABIZ04_01510 [Opitutus sp.]